jgi:hypothetical protein
VLQAADFLPLSVPLIHRFSSDRELDNPSKSGRIIQLRWTMHFNNQSDLSFPGLAFERLRAAKWEVRAGSIFIRAAAAYTENDDKTSIGTNLKPNALAHPPSKSSVGECIKLRAARSPGDNPGFEECYRLERISSGELAKCFG